MERALVKQFYDRFGRRQDAQRFYEDDAVADLIAHSEFATARSVFEFGCGTGRTAEKLLSSVLPDDAVYQAVDISTTMISLARQRLARFGDRASVRQIEGKDPFEGMDARVDRLITTYVLDFLPEEEIESFVCRSAETLTERGKLSIASLTAGTTLSSRVVTAGWRALFRISPRLVGGCRPIRLRPYLSASWRVEHHATITAFGIASEVTVATPVRVTDRGCG
jgi:SAM-dependent methyltransferase